MIRVLNLSRAFWLALSVALCAPAVSLAQPAEGVSEQQSVVNLNTASVEQLQSLPGIGPSKARAIVAYREQRPFRRVEDLLRVRGIGRSTFREIQSRLTVED